jgi:hypothetical protein
MSRRDEIDQATRWLRTRIAVKVMMREALQATAIVAPYSADQRNSVPLFVAEQNLVLVAPASSGMRVRLPSTPRARRMILLAFALGARRFRG